MRVATDITGLVLAGGRGSRMGGLDKGLQSFQGQPLAQHCLNRLGRQVNAVAINANRHLELYRAWGVPVWQDSPPTGQFEGPLAGFLVGMQHCQTPYLCTVACDTPLFPTDLVDRLAAILVEKNVDIVMAAAAQEHGQVQTQPVFCLLKVALRDRLHAFMEKGGRKIDAWTAGETTALAHFDRPGDDPRAFFNANTFDQLRQLERL